jgi:hypothetical protein
MTPVQELAALVVAVVRGLRLALKRVEKVGQALAT